VSRDFPPIRREGNSLANSRARIDPRTVWRSSGNTLERWATPAEGVAMDTEELLALPEDGRSKALSEHPALVVPLMYDWYTATAEAMYAIEDGETPELPKGYTVWSRLVALWCDVQGCPIDPEPMLRMQWAISAITTTALCESCRERNDILDRRERVGRCAYCNHPLRRPEPSQTVDAERLCE
jgi:hypothetical protein